MNEDSFAFVVYMIHACADRWNTTPSKVYQAIKKRRMNDTWMNETLPGAEFVSFP